MAGVKGKSGRKKGSKNKVENKEVEQPIENKEQHQKISEHIEKIINEEIVALASLLTIKSKEIKKLFKETRNNPNLHQLMIESHIISVLLEECSIDKALSILKNVREGLIKTDKIFGMI